MTAAQARKPFIKKFKRGKNYYVYDVNTNQIIELDEIEYKISGEFEDHGLERIREKFKDSYPAPDIENAFESIAAAKREEGLFSNYRCEHVT